MGIKIIGNVKLYLTIQNCVANMYIYNNLKCYYETVVLASSISTTFTEKIGKLYHPQQINYYCISVLPIQKWM